MRKIITVMALCAVAATAQEKTRVAVMSLKAGAGVEAAQMPSLTNMLCASLSERLGFEVIGQDDIRTMLSHAAAQQALGCDDTECLVKIGNALGVPYLVAGDVGMVGNLYIINLKLIDIDEMRVKSRQSREFHGPAAHVIDNLKDAGEKLFVDEAPDAEQPTPATSTVKSAGGQADKDYFSFTPIQISLISPLQTFGTRMSVYGLRVNLFYGSNRTVLGIDAGTVNRTTKRTIGIQAGVVNISRSCIGLQAGLVNIAGSMVGPQIGLINIIKRGRGARFAPIFNLGLGGG